LFAKTRPIYFTSYTSVDTTVNVYLHVIRELNMRVSEIIDEI